MIATLFFLSGASALAYQVVWARFLGLVFGNTVFAASAVLASFFAGLALGSALGGTGIFRRRAGLPMYACLEIVIGVFGVLVPLVIPALPNLYGALVQGNSISFAGLTAVRLVVSFLVLVVPCTAMGATLPVLVAARQTAAGSSKPSVAILYGINTLGSLAGCTLAGFLLIGHIGLLRTSWAAAILNGCVAVAACVLAAIRRRQRPQTKPAIPAPAAPRAPSGTALAPTRDWHGPLVLVLYGLCGFAALALEVGWTRALIWIIGLDTYAFTVMLAVILAGIGLGSLLARPLLWRFRDASFALPLLQACLGASVFLSLAAIQAGPDALRGLVSLVNSSPFLYRTFQAIGAYALVQLSVAGAVMFVPALLMGTSFPFFVRRYTGIGAAEAVGVSRVYAANTVGGIAGSVIMGFLLVPALGLLGSIALMGCLFFAVSLALLFTTPAAKPWTGWLARGAVAACAAAALLTMDTDFTHTLARTLAQEGQPDARIMYFREHATGAVMIKESALYGREMMVDGTQVASTGDFDLHSHLYPAHLISLLKKDISDVLVVAFGCGGTSGSLLVYDEVKRLDVVEICEGVIEPARSLFSGMNRNVFTDPRLALFIQDGKNYVKLTDRTYDVIYSGPIHPQSNQGSAALYTREYFEDCRKRLKPGGLQCLWVPLHLTDPRYFSIIVKTFMSVYPHVSMWYLPETDSSVSHPHLIGSMEEIPLDYQLISSRIARPGVRADLARLNETAFDTPEEFIAQRAMGEKGLQAMVGGITTLNTDDLPVVEYYTPAADLRAESKRSKANLISRIGKNLEDPFPSVVNLPPGSSAGVEAAVGRIVAGNLNLLLGHALLALEDFTGEDLSEMIRKYYREAQVLLPRSKFLRRYLGTGP
jgi:spermidine synthase